MPNVQLSAQRKPAHSSRWKTSQFLTGLIFAIVVNSIIVGGAWMWVESNAAAPGGARLILALYFLSPALLLLNVVGAVISGFIRSWWFSLGAVLSIPVGLMSLLVIIWLFSTFRL